MSVAETIAKTSGIPEPSKNERAEKRKELAETIINQEYRAATPNTPKRGRGRPSKAQQAAQSPKTNRPGPKSPEEVANDLRKRKCVKKLRALHTLFPEELGPSLAQFNYAAATIEEIENVIEACEFALEDDIEIQFYPKLLLQSLDQVETLGASAAALKPNHPVLRYGRYLRHFGDMARQDESVIKDIKLLSTNMLGLMPSSPTLRLLGTLAMVGFRCVQYNTQAHCVAETTANESEEFKDL